MTWRYEASSNEKKSMLVGFQKLYPDAVIGAMNSGDYVVWWQEDDGSRVKTLRIESKTLSDFMNSSRNQPGEFVSRLQGQLSKVGEGEKLVLLLRGVPNLNYDRFGNFQASQVPSYIGSLNMVYSAQGNVIPVADTNETALHAIEAIFNLHQKSGGRFYRSARPFKKGPWQMGMLAQIKGIGSVRAKLLLKAYPTVVDLAKAEQHDLEQIVGRAAGRDLYNHLREAPEW